VAPELQLPPDRVPEQLDRGRGPHGRLDFSLPFGATAGTARSGSAPASGTRASSGTTSSSGPFPRTDPSRTWAPRPPDFTRAHLGGNYPYGVFTRPETLGDLELLNSSRFRLQDRPDEYAAGNYDASESIQAGYLLWDRTFGNGLGIIAGVRVERTGVDYEGFEFDEDTDEVRPTPEQSDAYTNVCRGSTSGTS
jgi:hypothetical protein